MTPASLQPAPDTAFANPYFFHGRRIEPESGLYYYRNRDYDPDGGRFVQRDPRRDVHHVGNPYLLHHNHPAAGVDPLGLSSHHEAPPVQLEEPSATDLYVFVGGGQPFGDIDWLADISSHRQRYYRYDPLREMYDIYTHRNPPGPVPDAWDPSKPGMPDDPFAEQSDEEVTPYLGPTPFTGSYWPSEVSSEVSPLEIPTSDLTAYGPTPSLGPDLEDDAVLGVHNTASRKKKQILRRNRAWCLERCRTNPPREAPQVSFDTMDMESMLQEIRDANHPHLIPLPPEDTLKSVDVQDVIMTVILSDMRSPQAPHLPSAGSTPTLRAFPYVGVPHEGLPGGHGGPDR